MRLAASIITINQTINVIGIQNIENEDSSGKVPDGQNSRLFLLEAANRQNLDGTPEKCDLGKFKNEIHIPIDVTSIFLVKEANWEYNLIIEPKSLNLTSIDSIKLAYLEFDLFNANFIIDNEGKMKKMKDVEKCEKMKNVKNENVKKVK
ncbi:hypothetical protein Glove_166g205 [Diversispora epigaea]|uniref:Uncharacterized protein n=1 Tax=Diversispora epigaea TaxID=1348612 RepID=A0A397IZZ9_9GLOM|nr:hypothetical protein Glove_166g205 [Diversispora epigaea]